jgi:hypothetical protein
MLRAIAETGSGDSVLPFRDDLSCGPIASDDPASRGAWWGQFYDMGEVETELRAFWHRLESTDARIVLWFGRMTANELAFFLACSERLAEREYDVVYVTALRGKPSASIVRPEILTSLLGEQRRPSPQERRDSADRWHRLRSEDAPFRIVTPEGLVSAPAEHFDNALLSHMDGAWRNVNRVVADTMGLSFEPHWQVGDLMLKARLVALAESGSIELTGHPIERGTMVRLVAADD